jgi:hypothetical protein
MRTTPEAFIDEVRNRPKFIAAAARDPVFVEHLSAIEYAIERINELGNDDAVWIDRFDQVRTILGRDEQPLKARLLEFGRVLQTWSDEAMRRPGH